MFICHKSRDICNVIWHGIKWDIWIKQNNWTFNCVDLPMNVLKSIFNNHSMIGCCMCE